MIRHDRFLELAAISLDFDLTPEERATLAAHLRGCAACANTVRMLRGDAAALAGVAVSPLGMTRQADILERVLLPSQRVPVMPLRLVFVAALIALLAMASFVVGADLLRRADDTSVVPPDPSTVILESAPPTASVPSPLPTSTAPVDGMLVGQDWSRVTLPDLVVPDVGGASMSGVIAGGPGAIAWGQAYASDPPVWTTADGRSWTRAWVEVPNDWSDENPGTIITIAPGGPGYVAGGFYFREGTGHRALIWTSVDGTAWDLLPYDPIFEHAIVSEIVPWGDELLAYGSWSAGPSGGATTSLLWTSRDGVTWRSEALSLPAGRTLGFQAATVDRLWAMSGVEGDDLGIEPSIVLSSVDGRTWVPAELPAYPGRLHSLGASLMSLVEPIPDGTEPGSGRHPSPGVYGSTDLRAWVLASHDPAAVGHDLVALDGVSIMVGNDGPARGGCSSDCRATAWRSVDGGQTWDRAEVTGDEGTMERVAALADGTLVAVGMTITDPGFPTPAAWVSTPPAMPGASPRPGSSPSAAPSGPPAPTDVAATTEGSGQVGTDFTVHVRWTPATPTLRHRIYEYDTGAGPGYGVCVFDKVRGWQVLETGPDATTADVSLPEAVSGAGVRCLYLVAVDGAGESAPTLAWRSSD